MTLIGEVFAADVLGKTVLDPAGDEIGRLRDIVVAGGGPFPRVTGLLLEKRKALYHLPWEDVSIFNRRIISSSRREGDLPAFQPTQDTLLIGKDLYDKQIVDIDGAKIVRVNDVRLGEEGGSVYVTDVDVGVRGILRRLGVERKGEAFFRTIRTPLRPQLIAWSLIQPIHEKLDRLTLSVTRRVLGEMHPADVAHILSGMSPEERKGFFEKLDLSTAAETLHELTPEVQADLISEMDKEKAADLIEQMPPDEAADLIADLPVEKAQEILSLIEKEEAEDIHELLGHEEDTAGGLMTNEYLAFPPGITVGEALARFRTEAAEIEAVYYIYVVEEERLAGVIGLRELILEDPGRRLEEVMHQKLITVPAEAGQQTVAELISKYNLLALPVVDAQGCLLGVVTVDDVVDLLLPPASRRKRRRM